MNFVSLELLKGRARVSFMVNLGVQFYSYMVTPPYTN